MYIVPGPSPAQGLVQESPSVTGLGCDGKIGRRTKYSPSLNSLEKRWDIEVLKSNICPTNIRLFHS